MAEAQVVKSVKLRSGDGDSSDNEEGSGQGGLWTRAAKRLRRNRVGMAALCVLIVVVLLSLSAPLYAEYVAHTNPFSSNLGGTTFVNGKKVDVIQQGGGSLGLGEIPIGATWNFHHYFLGADSEGRDVAARLLYGGRNSLVIGIGSALVCCLIATVLALISGFLGGPVDAILSRLMDIVWAFPVFLLAILISTVSLTQGLRIGPLAISTNGVLLPLVIIAFIYVPYVFRPIRGQVLAVREKVFIQAAIIQGASARWLMFSEILPNVLATVIVFVPLMIAVNILTESGLSFLGIGVQPPGASWGTIISDGESLLYTRPWVAIAPGIMITLTVVSLNLLGDAIRDALDPRASVGGTQS